MEMRYGIKLLEVQLENIQNLKFLTRNNINFIYWNNLTTNILEQLLGTNHELVIKFRSIQYKPAVIWGNRVDKSKFKEKYLQGLNEAAQILKKVIKELYMEEDISCFERKVRRNSNAIIKWDKEQLDFHVRLTKEDLISLLKDVIDNDKLTKEIEHEIEFVFENSRVNGADKRVRINKLSNLLNEAVGSSIYSAALNSFLSVLEFLKV